MYCLSYYALKCKRNNKMVRPLNLKSKLIQAIMKPAPNESPPLKVVNFEAPKIISVENRYGHSDKGQDSNSTNFMLKLTLWPAGDF